MTWVKALHPFQPNHREEAAYLPPLLAGLMLGASFLFGDGIISPAISVLAVEGLEVVTPIFRGAVIPITVAILALLSRSLCVTATEYCRAT
ncbi:MAG: KUP/HAK/KT family potassium transporter [Terriglobales bacterium]